MKKNILVTGLPKAGKSTAIIRLSDILRGKRISGFFTREIREDGERVGFEIETFAGERGMLAHIRVTSDHHVSRYGVNLREFERVAIPAMNPHPATELVIIDEIGKMECFSSRFVQAMENLLESEVPVVATVALKGSGFIQQVKSRSDVEILTLSMENRDGLPKELAGRIGR